jgi:hypothetical protein
MATKAQSVKMRARTSTSKLGSPVTWGSAKDTLGSVDYFQYFKKARTEIVLFILSYNNLISRWHSSQVCSNITDSMTQGDTEVHQLHGNNGRTCRLAAEDVRTSGTRAACQAFTWNEYIR